MFRAALVKCRTIKILVNEVSIISKVGAMAIIVNVIKILRLPFSCPFPSLYVMVTVLAIFSSFKSSGVCAVPGSSTTVLSSVEPVSWDSRPDAYTETGRLIHNNMPTINSRHINLIPFLPEKYFFIYLAYSSFFRLSSFRLAISSSFLKSGTVPAGLTAERI